jgi:hypothetical protein
MLTEENRRTRRKSVTLPLDDYDNDHHHHVDKIRLSLRCDYCGERFKVLTTLKVSILFLMYGNSMLLQNVTVNPNENNNKFVDKYNN